MRRIRGHKLVKVGLSSKDERRQDSTDTEEDPYNTDNSDSYNPTEEEIESGDQDGKKNVLLYRIKFIKIFIFRKCGKQ